MKQDFIIKLKNFFERGGKIFAVRNDSKSEITADIKEFMLFIDTKNMIEEESYRLVGKQVIFLKEENEKLKNRIKELEKYKKIVDEIKLRRSVLNLEADRQMAKRLMKTHVPGELREKEDEEVVKVLADFDELKPPKF